MFEKTKGRIREEIAAGSEAATNALDHINSNLSTALYVVAGFLAMILLALVTRAR